MRPPRRLETIYCFEMRVPYRSGGVTPLGRTPDGRFRSFKAAKFAVLLAVAISREHEAVRWARVG